MNTKKAVARLPYDHQFYLINEPNIIVQIRAANTHYVITDYEDITSHDSLPRPSKEFRQIRNLFNNLSIESKMIIEHWIKERRRNQR